MQNNFFKKQLNWTKNEVILFLNKKIFKSANKLAYF